MAALLYFFYLLMKPFTIIMAAIGILGVFAPYVNPNTWWIPAFSGLFLPAILIVNFCLLLFWIFHKKRWLLFPLITLTSNYNFYNSMYQNPYKKIPVTTGKTLTIASYNVEGFYWLSRNSNQQKLRQIIEENEIDVICFQEHCESPTQPIDTTLGLIGLPHRKVFFNHKAPWANYGMSVYSKYPIVNHDTISFNSLINGAMWVDIAIDQDTVRIFNNHLQTTDLSLNKKAYYKQKSIKNWKGQARILVQILGSLKENFLKRANQSILVRRMIDTTRYPVIVCGDFNDTPVSFSFNHIRRPDMKDGFKDCGKGYGHSFNGLKRLLRIDFITYGKFFQGIYYESPQLEWSDHNPVIMKLIFKDTST